MNTQPRKFCPATYGLTWALLQRSSYKNFAKYTNKKKNCTILDIGTGTGEYIKSLGKANTYIFTDVDPTVVNKIQSRAKKYLQHGAWSIEIGDAKDIINTPRKIHVVSLVHVASLIPNLGEFISNTLEKLPKKGELIIYTAEYPWGMHYIYKLLMRVFRFSPIEVSKIIRLHGQKIYSFQKKRIGLFTCCYLLQK